MSVTVREIFNSMPSRFNREASGDLNATVAFNLTGDQGGQWTVRIAGGQVSVSEGTASSPDTTITMDAQDYIAMITGELNAMMAFMSGKVKVDGNLDMVMKFQSLFM